MKGPTKPGMTIILEDAYKQNTVYRPWWDITSGRPLDKDPVSPEKAPDVRCERTPPR